MADKVQIIREIIDVVGLCMATSSLILYFILYTRLNKKVLVAYLVTFSMTLVMYIISTIIGG